MKLLEALREDLNDIRGIAVKIQPQAIRECSRLYDICNRIEKRVEAALAASEPAAESQVCEKQWHMYVWTQLPRWVAIAQAENVEHAREVMLEEIGTSHDGSCPEREAADKWVRENNPAIFYFRNAEFALTDSAELREQEDYSNKLQKQLDDLKKASAQGKHQS